MTTEPLGATLDLDISDALANVATLGDSVDTQLADGADSFTSAMAAAIDAIPVAEVTVEPTGEETITAGIDSAVAASDSTVTVEADGTEAITGDINAAVESADSLVTVEADTTDAAAAIDALGNTVDITTDVNVDINEALQALHDLVAEGESNPIDIPVEADTTEAQGALDDLAGSASDAGGAIDTTQQATDRLGQALPFVAAGAGAATGSFGKFNDIIGGANEGMGKAVVGAGAISAAMIGLFHAGVDAQGSMQRFTSTTGEFQSKVEAIHVGDLNANLQDLAIQLGTDDEAMQNAASTLFQMAKVAGATGDQASEFTGKLTALAARAVALNPALGDVSGVAEQMGVRLARGGRFAQRFGLDLSAAEINARALEMTGKDTVAELSIYEKVQAAATIAVEKYGNTLNDTVNTGANNAIIVQRRLKEEINNVIEAVGKTIVIPMFDIIEASIPIVQAFGEAIGVIAQVALPAFGLAVQGIAELLTGFVQGLSIIADSVPTEVWIGMAAGIAVVAGAMIGWDVVIGATIGALYDLAVALASNPITLFATILAVGITALGLFGGASEQAHDKTEDFRDALIDANGALDEHAEKALRAAAEQFGIVSALAKAGVSFKAYEDALSSATHLTDKQRSALDALDDGVNAITMSNGLFIERLQAIDPALATLAIRLDKAGALTPGVRIGLVRQALATKDATDTTNEYNKVGADNASIQKRQADATNALKKEISSQADTIAQAMPTAAQAFDTASKAVDDFNSAVTSGMPDASKAFDDAAAAADKFGGSINVEIFQNKLNETLDTTRGFADDLKVILDTGATDLAKVLAAKGPEAAGALTHSLAEGIRDGTGGDTVPAMNQAARDIATAADGIKTAMSPQAWLDELKKSFAETSAFFGNLKYLADLGLTSLATELATRGPVVGGSMAAQIADGIRNGTPGAARAAVELDQNIAATLIQNKAIKTAWDTVIGPEILAANETNYGALRTRIAQQYGIELPATLSGAKGQVQAAGNALGTGASTGFGEGAAGMTGEAGTATQNASNAINSATNMTEAARAQGMSVGTDWGTAVIEGVETYRSAINTVAQSVIPGPGIGEADKGRAIGGRFGDGMAQGISASEGSIHAAAAAVVPTGGIGAEDWGTIIGARWGNSMADGIRGAEGNIHGAAAGVIPTGGLGAEDWGYTIGQRFGYAIGDGITSATGYVQARARELVQAAKTAAENAGSPSVHLFYDAGESFSNALVEGWDSGLSSFASKVATSIARISEAKPPGGTGTSLLDIDALARAIAHGSGGVTVISVASMREARSYLPAQARQHPAFLDGRGAR